MLDEIINCLAIDTIDKHEEWAKNEVVSSSDLDSPSCAQLVSGTWFSGILATLFSYAEFQFPFWISLYYMLRTKSEIPWNTQWFLVSGLLPYEFMNLKFWELSTYV